MLREEKRHNLIFFGHHEKKIQSKTGKELEINEDQIN